MTLGEPTRAIYRALFVHLCDRQFRVVLPDLMQELERLAISTALTYCGANEAKAAKLLGISKALLTGKRQRLGIPLNPRDRLLNG